MSLAPSQASLLTTILTEDIVTVADNYLPALALVRLKYAEWKEGKNGTKYLCPTELGKKFVAAQA